MKGGTLMNLIPMFAFSKIAKEIYVSNKIDKRLLKSIIFKK